MAIKSQQDVKIQTKAKGEKVPKVFEKVAQNDTRQTNPPQDQPIVPLIQRVENIENYLKKVDIAFEKIVIEIDTLKKINHVIDSEMSKITGDFVRLTKLEEDRYIELATAINSINEKLTTMDEYIPIFIDKKLDDYFENLIAETGSSNEPVNDNQEPT
jgi:hypothetical protein